MIGRCLYSERGFHQVRRCNSQTNRSSKGRGQESECTFMGEERQAVKVSESPLQK